MTRRQAIMIVATTGLHSTASQIERKSLSVESTRTYKINSVIHHEDATYIPKEQETRRERRARLRKKPSHY